MEKGSTEAMYKYLEMIYCNLTTMFNPFHATGLFRYPPPHRKHQQTKGFLMFSEGIERDQWHQMS